MALHPEASTRRRGRGALFAVSGVVLAGGIAVLALEVYPSMAGSDHRPARPEPAASAPRAAAASAETTAPAVADAPSDHETLHDAAVAELRALEKSTSPRVRRLAAQALARTAEPAALELLRTMLRDEPSQLSKIQIAYALGRAGDAQAVTDLRAMLTAERRDVRLDAARSLVQLGDDSGARALRAMLDIDTHRIGAAGLLARLGDQEGLEVLRAEATSKQASAEARMRAAVALGRAGDASVRPQLVEILADRRYNVGAADALAALGDPAAVEALDAQLALSAVRVPAALWLRRMKKQVNLQPLALAIESGDEASRVSAAEALLVLTGPDAMAERD
jgi:HEAT repeat protein